MFSISGSEATSSQDIQVAKRYKKAEQKTFSLFGSLKPLKLANPDLILGLTGCLGQQDGKKLRQRMHYIDFVMVCVGLDLLSYCMNEESLQQITNINRMIMFYPLLQLFI